MKKKKFAMMIMGPYYDPQQHQAHFETSWGDTYIVTVRDFEEAKEKIRQLQQMGVGAVEVCGGFGPERTKELIALTNGELAVGYVTSFPEQAPLFDKVFGD